MLHIMHLIESLEFGGAEKVLVHLANKLSDSHKISVCLTKRKGELVEQLDERIQVYFLDTGEGNGLALPKKLKRLLASEKVDVLHSHDWGVYLEAALAVTMNPSTRLIHTVHGHYIQYASDWRSQLKKKLRNFLERLSSRKTFQIVPVSDSIKQYIVQDIGVSEKKVKVIRNGIAPIGEKTGQPMEQVRLVTVGRLAKIKNYSMMLKAIAKVDASKMPFELTIVGDGPEMNELKKLTQELNLEKHVSFTGFRTDVSEILKQHDVFLCSSDYEGISIAILEAMSIGLPVVATRVGGVPETVVDQQTGLLVEPNDETQFAQAIEQILGSSQLRDSFGEAGKVHFTKHFHEDVVLEQYESVYQESQS